MPVLVVETIRSPRDGCLVDGSPNLAPAVRTLLNPLYRVANLREHIPARGDFLKQAFLALAAASPPCVSAMPESRASASVRDMSAHNSRCFSRNRFCSSFTFIALSLLIGLTCFTWLGAQPG